MTAEERCGTVTVVEILGLGPWLAGNGMIPPRNDSGSETDIPLLNDQGRFLPGLALSEVVEGGMESGGQVTGISGNRVSLVFPGRDGAAQALNGAIRIIDRFRSQELSSRGVSVRIGLDHGALCPIDENHENTFQSAGLAPAGGVFITGLPLMVASDLVMKARPATAFLTQSVADAAGDGFCFDEVSRLRLPDYPEKIVTMALCGRC
ncbi:MAG: hypothetical protein CVV64_13680 [Candidatus Wallbacteria bacterium HGW-Wallbacteria-1]|uniref:Guanylate cyclase domain-containing protein n=1 Tax=Candidatus Wallbacteria bacterium HGW-Wallbacteria-1 TaxID=2013854 RepID=A0A2N1PMN5_9BACT|nr:MAG: hypothetical protein CVV64_13680 [Candidatus Wallbacteria bacterium HGW-Wallbacteria-1]